MVEKIKNGITEMVFIIDKSGSMAGMEEDTVGGFNAMIEKQKKIDGKCYVSTVLFSNRSSVLHDRIDIQKIEPLTEREYCVGGGTALLDAIGGAIHHIGNVHKYARNEDVPEHTIFVITSAVIPVIRASANVRGFPSNRLGVAVNKTLLQS